MKKIAAFIKKIFKDPKTSIIILALLLVLVSIFAVNSCNRANRAEEEKITIIERNERNIAVMNDTIRKIFNRQTNQFESLKRTYEVANQEQLEKYDQKLAAEIGKMGKNIMDYIKVSGKINLGDTILDNKVIKYNDNKYGLKWKLDYDDGGFKQEIIGTSNFNLIKKFTQTPTGTDVDIKIGSDGTKIDSNETTIKLALAHRVIEKDGKSFYEIVATSPSSKIVFDTLSSVYFIEKFPCEQKYPKVRRVTLGPYIGVGLSTGIFQVGFGAQYNLRWSDMKSGIKSIFKK